MSASDRQSRLLVSEDWKRIYQSFRNADFSSYDFDNLRRTMINYLRQNYPEDFNDYIESSEYLALIDMIAFLGQNLSFRIDLNARETFVFLPLMFLTLWMGIYPAVFMDPMHLPVAFLLDSF